jgi:hypothetical protein
VNFFFFFQTEYFFLSFNFFNIFKNYFKGEIAGIVLGSVFGAVAIVLSALLIRKYALKRKDAKRNQQLRNKAALQAVQL